MRYYFDTEFFEHDDRVEPISIGVVAEDGREFYAEVVSKADVLSMPHPWLHEHVAPHLTGPKLSHIEVKDSLVAFVGGDTTPEFWAFWGAYDWVVLCQLFGGMLKLPSAWVYKFKEFADLRIRVAKGPDQHNALADARAMFDAVKKLDRACAGTGD